MSKPKCKRACPTLLGRNHPREGRSGRGRILPKFAQEVDIPDDNDVVLWDGNLRMDLPQYVTDQLQVAAQCFKRTRTSFILRLMAFLRDADGELVFYIRDEDLVPDRRKAVRKPH